MLNIFCFRIKKKFSHLPTTPNCKQYFQLIKRGWKKYFRIRLVQIEACENDKKKKRSS